MDRVIRKQNFLVAFVVLIIFACGAFISSSVLAQEKPYTGLGVRVSDDPDDPKADRTIFKYKLNPNNKKEDSIHVDNNMKSSAKFRLYSVDSQSPKSGGHGCNSSNAQNIGVGNWTKLKKEEIELQPGQKGDFKFSLAVPANAEVGEHSGCLVMERTDEKGKENQGGATIKLRSAIRVSVLVPGDVKRQLSIGNFSFNYEDLQAEGQEKLSVGLFSVETINSGNVSASVKQEIVIKNLFGGVAHSIDSRMLSMNGYRYKDHSGKEKIHNGRSNKKLMMTQNEHNKDFKPFWGGFYKATLKMSYDKRSDRRVKVETVSKDDLAHEEKTITIFLWPSIWAIIIGIVTILAIIAVVWWLIGKRKNEKQKKPDDSPQKIKILWGKYTVKNGETLRILADKHDVTLARIAKINKITPNEKLKVGQVVYVPKKRVKLSEKE